MTENKRFKLAYKKGDWWAVRDGEITLWKEEVIHLLNELYEENVELKQENHDIKYKIEELYYTYIYEPSENYDEDSCDKIIRGILKGVEKDE